MTSRIAKYIVGVLVVVAVFIVGVSVGHDVPAPASSSSENRIITKNQQSTTSPQASTSVKVSVKTVVQPLGPTASLMIDFGNGKLQTFKNIPITNNATVFSVLQAAATKNNIVLKYTDYKGDLGVFIEAIGGIGKDPEGKKWWQFWVNNVYSQVGVSSAQVKAGDVIEFKFIQGQV
jgi:hypothetical protein